MGAQSKIEWTDATWNPVMGCTPVSAGCENCYARAMMARFAGRKGWPKTASTVTLFPERLEQPLHWKKPRRIFVCSMSDFFHEDVPDEFIDAAFAVMAAAERHTFQLLTKRADRMARYFEELPVRAQMYPALGRRSVPYETSRILEMWREHALPFVALPYSSYPDRRLPLSNVWGMVTTENQKQADKRIPFLLQCPFAVYGVSAEPLLSELDLSAYLRPRFSDKEDGNGLCDFIPPLNHVIVGGESGPNARPMHPDWARGLRDQCQEKGVPFFFKQNGAAMSLVEGLWMKRVGKKRAGRLLDGREWNEYPRGR